MIKVTIWNEFVQEQFTEENLERLGMQDMSLEYRGKNFRRTPEIRKVHPDGIHQTLKTLIEEESDLQVRHIATLEMPECGLTEEVLQDTDVCVWWSHIAQDQVADEIVKRVQEHVLKGMGIIFLHSAHISKPMRALLGTSGTLRWREGDRCRIWTTNPAHPIAKGIPEYIELDEEEMYGEFFDIPTPDDQVFLSWYSGGEVFRSGCTWTRGLGRIFYFQPGHETNRSYFHPTVRQVIRNAVRWTAGNQIRRTNLECIHAEQQLC